MRVAARDRDQPVNGAGFYDVALRDFGLALGALALGRLSQDFSS
jgi:hypothetical protein